MNSKNILFLHPNFPGQFKNLATTFGLNSQIDARFLCMTNHGNRIKGVKALIINGERGQDAMERKKMNEFDNMRFRADSYRLAFKSIKDSGWNPDIIIGHTGWGCGIHVKDIWSNCLFLGYSEWWFNLNSEFNKSAKLDRYMDIKENKQIKLMRRNQYMAMELCIADRIIAPTKYQRSQLPSLFKEACIVINDGIDFKLFSKIQANPTKNPVITYGTRGMEPMRCFRQFIKSIPHIVNLIPSASIEIAGEDKICYGGLPPNNNETWGEWAKRYLKKAKVDKHVIWKDRMNFADYRDWLQRSWCHVYLTQPFVASWSLIEAMMTGIPIVGNNAIPIQEFTSNAKGVFLIDALNSRDVANSIVSLLTDSKSNQISFKRHCRADSLGNVEIGTVLRQWERVTGLELHTSI